MNDQEMLQQARYLIDTGVQAPGAVLAAVLKRQGEVTSEGLRPLIARAAELAGASGDPGLVNKAIDAAIAEPALAPMRRAAPKAPGHLEQAMAAGYAGPDLSAAAMRDVDAAAAARDPQPAPPTYEQIVNDFNARRDPGVGLRGIGRENLPVPAPLVPAPRRPAGQPRYQPVPEWMRGIGLHAVQKKGGS